MRGDRIEGLVVLWVVVSALVLLAAGGLALAPGGSRDEDRWLARVALAAPLWPAMLVFVLARSLVRIVRLAASGRG